MTTVYTVQLRLHLPTGIFTEWMTPEAFVAHTMAEAVVLIGEHADAARGITLYLPAGGAGIGAFRVIRVIKADLESGLCSDVTEDALLAYGEDAVSRGDEWPWWLNDLAPDYLREGIE